MFAGLYCSCDVVMFIVISGLVIFDICEFDFAGTVFTFCFDRLCCLCAVWIKFCEPSILALSIHSVQILVERLRFTILLNLRF